MAEARRGQVFDRVCPVQNSRIALKLISGMRERADPGEIAGLFSSCVQFEIAGDFGALPWVGRRVGRGAILEFMRDTRLLIERLRFDVEDILVSDHGVAIVGELVSRIFATGKAVESAFAIILTVAENGEISRFQMLEDSYAVSRAARP
jgi:ketosteroid isomerase-like protein